MFDQRRHRWIVLAASLVVALVVTMGGNSRRLMVAAERAAIVNGPNNNRPCQHDTNSYPPNPAHFLSDQGKLSLPEVVQPLPAAAEHDSSLQLKWACVCQMLPGLRTKLRSLQAYSVRLQL